MLKAAIALTVFPMIAHGQDTYSWSGPHTGPSKVQIHAPTVPDAVATVTFDNTSVHGSDDSFSITFQDITVHVDFEWNVDRLGSERITVYAPDGYTALPPSVDVREDQSDEIHIIEWVGG